MVSKKTSKKQVEKIKNKTKSEKIEKENIETDEKPTVKWEPVSKENKGNGNFFAKMIDFFHF